MATQPANPIETAGSETIIIKKVIGGHHDEHHGGGWKVAYADFVTAMMAFFMLLWIINSTTEEQKNGIADYFAPTLIHMDNGGGSDGLLQGRTILSPDGTAPNEEALVKEIEKLDKKNFKKVEKEIEKKLKEDKELSALKEQVRLLEAPEGLRIDVIDRSGSSMFERGTSVLTPAASKLMREVATSVSGFPNKLAIRGHTDSTRYATDQRMNNWYLSSQRAEATRQVFAEEGIADARFARIEGVADKEPYNKKDAEDPRNRRISVILLNLGEPGKKPTAEGVAALRADNLTQSRALEAFDLAAKTRVGSRIAAKPADGHAAKPAPAQH